MSISKQQNDCQFQNKFCYYHSKLLLLYYYYYYFTCYFTNFVF